MFQHNIFEGEPMFDMALKASSENEPGELKDDAFVTKSVAETTDTPSEDDTDPNQRPSKKKRYHRHTLHQIQEMETFFKECPHPDDKQRKELSKELGLEPLQVKFWFQNKRTQMKAQHERHENAILKAENDKLRAENCRYKESLSGASCSCGGPAAMGEMFDEQLLRLENARLREEIDRVSAIAAKFVGKPVQSYSLSHQVQPRFDLSINNLGSLESFGGEMYGALDLLRANPGYSHPDKPTIVEIAVAAMEELVKMAQSREPLWVPGDNGAETLNDEEYCKVFPRGIGSKLLGLSSEASRQSAVVMTSHVSIVEIFMNATQWANIFCGIVSNAMTIDVLSTGVGGNHNGALQVMTAEFQLPTPLVPAREHYFVRYCKKHGEGTWAVVDVSLDTTSTSSRSRRRPSGCIIQDLQNGYSKVTWVEHIETDDRQAYNIYRHLLSSGMAFGASRWVATLDRQCERLASSMALNIPVGDPCAITSPKGRKSMLKLAERMMISFCSGVGSSNSHSWNPLSPSGSDDVRVMTRKNVDDPGRPPGIVLSAATSFWIPVPPKRVFDFLRDENHRNEWDILSNGGHVQEMTHIANGRDPGNCVSLLRVNSANAGQNTMLILQESCTDNTGSYVVYAPVDIASMDVVLGGGDPDYVALLPSGYAILPDGPCYGSGGIIDVGSGGSLLTVAFQILVDSVPTARLSLGSVATVNKLIKCTVQKISAAVVCDTN